ncbi:hypothetical protein KR054_007856 [Drosophila jambulina]|nr:hypothetical protein KR054_007856 [Drosophila jambulina]
MSHLSPAQARESISLTTETDSDKIARYELATCRAENFLLRQRMAECEATIQSLKQMVASIADKQVEILGEVVEMRNCGQMPVKSHTDSATSTAQDVSTEQEQVQSDDWNSSSQSTLVFSPYISPQASSDSDELDARQEEYDLVTHTMPVWSILYSIKEEIEPDDSQEQQQEQEDSDPLS